MPLGSRGLMARLEAGSLLFCLPPILSDDSIFPFLNRALRPAAA